MPVSAEAAKTRVINLGDPGSVETAKFSYELNTLFGQTRNLLRIPVPEAKDVERIMGFIKDNNDTSRILRHPEYLKILARETELKGDCKVGTVICIDGRISIIHQFGRSVNTWEVAGSLVESERRGNGRVYLTSPRLVDALTKTALSEEGRDLLEIVTAHTSADSHGRCGKMTAVTKVGGGDVNTNAINAAELRAQAIENKYNEILEQKGKPQQAQVSLVAMIDTDTMGLSLNFGKDHALSTTSILMNGNLINEIEGSIGTEVGQFGSMKETFAQKNEIITYANRVEKITRHLMTTEGNSAKTQIENYIAGNYPKLTLSQKQALFFTLCRTIANQYVTGLSGERTNHPFNQHDEQYVSVSSFGKPFGRFDYTRETFGSMPDDREDALEHVKIKLDIMDSHEEPGQREPRIIFVSNPINGGILKLPGFEQTSTYSQAIDSSRRYYAHLLNDPELRVKIDAREVIVVPILVDEDTGKALRVLGDTSFFVPQGEALPEMPPLS